MNIGEKIKELRIEKGMTLEQVGNLVGVGKSTVRKWEVGMIENMRRDKIEKLAVALGVSPDFFFEDASLKSAPVVNVTASPLSPSEDKLLRNYRILDQEDRQQVDMIMDTFVSKEKYKKDSAGRIA